MNMLLRTPTLAATALAAISVFGSSAGTYNDRGEIPADQDLAVVTFSETVASGRGF